MANCLSIDNYSFPERESERLDAVVAALAAGDVPKALAGARIEIRLTTMKGAPGATGSMGDAFHGAKIYAVALELYRTFLSRVPTQDVRRAEVTYRAGVTARRLRMYEVAIRLLADAARVHERADRVAASEKAVDEMEARLASTSPDGLDALIAGPCAVIRRTSGQIDVSEIGRLVSRASGKPLAEATRLLKGSPGFLAFDLEPTKAKELAVNMAGLGIPSLVIPQDRLVALPAPVELSHVELTNDGLVLPENARPAAGPVTLWRDVFYASAGIVTVEKEPSAPAPSIDYMPSTSLGHHTNDITQTWAMDELRRSRKTVEEKAMLDVFTLDPFQRYRIIDGSCRFRTPGPTREPQSHNSIERFAAALCGYGANVPSNEGTIVLALDCPRMRWRELTFDGVSEFDRYNYWRLQLEQYG